MSKIANSRYQIISLAFSAAALFMVIQIILLQHNPQKIELSQDLYNLHEYIWINHEPERGRIYDRNGFLLAGSKTVYEIGIDLSVENRDAHTIASVLMQYFADEYPLDYQQLYEFASWPYDAKTAVYIPIVVLNNIPQETINELDVLKDAFQAQRDTALRSARTRKAAREVSSLPSLAGLTWQPRLQRYYPEDQLASNIIGFTTFMQPDNKVGMFGLESYYQEKLLTETTVSYISRLPYENKSKTEIPLGQSLVLTIDRNIQEEVESILDNAVKKNNADSGTIIVMNPKNGEVIAMATNPRMNPNQYWNWGKDMEGAASFNKAIGDTYEPGSVFKIITMSIGLESGAVTPETTYEDIGVISVGGREVYNWNNQAMGLMDMGTCLRKSSNVCLVWVGAEKIKSEIFYKGLHAFGLNRRTNIDLDGEGLYPLKEPGTADWTLTDLGRQAFGHGISLTPIQMITAISAVANNGRIMAPHILKSVVVDGVQYDNIPQMIGNPISEKTAQIITDMLIIKESPAEVETWNAFIPGYTFSGKTGTAVKVDANGQYNDSQTSASFVGWGPSEDPQFIVYVWIERPQYETYASMVAAPVFKEVAEYLITVMDIPPDEIRLALPAQNGGAP
ncbi:MAG: penicillin-binding protein 2 [Anaerolineae bacterium]|nr:penicillin-binding protein 2 [Anaerolineae bacterium]